MNSLSPESRERVHAVHLRPHPDNPPDAVRAIEVQVRRTPEGALEASYVVYGDLERVRVPPPGPRRIGERLWAHTCCEMFVRVGEETSYHEFNFSPSGEWAAYAFERYREGAPLPDAALDRCTLFRNSPVMLTLDAAVRLDRLSPAHSSAPLSVALSAVIEDADGRLSDWALAHPPGRPDFHAPASFVLRIE